MPAYALIMTIYKAQGQTLNNAIVWFDVDTVRIATGYVAVSRVIKLDDMLFFTMLKTWHFKANTIYDVAGY